MSLTVPKNLQSFSSLFLRLPRELRDLVYPDVVNQSSPIPLSNPEPHPITNPLLSNATVATEALEAFYANNTFIVPIPSTFGAPPTWTAHPHLQFIRRVIATADEAFNIHDGNCLQRLSETMAPTEILHQYSYWTSLLSLTSLQSLTIHMEKRANLSLKSVEFAPTLYILRSRSPPPDIQFCISFDVRLKELWDYPFWDDFYTESNPMPVSLARDYEPAGWIDMSELFGPATEEDRKYVEEYLPDRVMPEGRNVQTGLLDCSPDERRALAKHYVVSEPELLRVMMEEHYEFWKKYKSIEAEGVLK
ncbi:hypothetical protein CC78DRAFT_529752 [Lojkania enalia]|uniref:Uncharacterized protein n=1 Tax=Lojkania enalia TaxID=147567 RepID=A0A9P4KJS2_9PLEO|nr:hypothetical protein CC78DRAFT_529752 [Didymosphaeria enalia]